jgi:hypothetical protein
MSGRLCTVQCPILSGVFNNDSPNSCQTMVHFSVTGGAGRGRAGASNIYVTGEYRCNPYVPLSRGSNEGTVRVTRGQDGPTHRQGTVKL